MATTESKIYTAYYPGTVKLDATNPVAAQVTQGIAVVTDDRFATEGSLAGNKDWSLFLEGERDLAATVAALQSQVTNQGTEITNLKTQVHELSDFSLPTFIRNVVGQWLLFLVGRQPPSPPLLTTSRIAQATPKTKRIITAGLASSGVMTWREFEAIADPVIDRRNTTVHYGTAAALMKDVDKAKSYLVTFPALRQSCRQEARLLDVEASVSIEFGFRR